jgi:hypothetical protein
MFYGHSSPQSGNVVWSQGLQTKVKKPLQPHQAQ